MNLTHRAKPGLSKARRGVLLALGAAGLAFAAAAPAFAAERLTLTLNWTAKADHAPYYYALKQGWYQQAGVELTIEGGRGSAATVQRVAAGASEVGIADMATLLVARGKGADVRAVMSLYTVSPQTFYWLKSSPIKGPADFAGKRIGGPAGDAGVAMFPAFAKATGIDPKSVTFVNVTPAAKISSLKSGVVDIVPYFFDVHDYLIDEFGSNVSFLRWKDVGLNPYGNVIFAKESALVAKRQTIDAFVKVSQKAFAACMENYQPCLDAVMAASSGLNATAETKSWRRIKSLLSDQAAQTIALGWLDGDRVQKDYELIGSTIGIEKAFDPKSSFTTEFLDKGIKVDPANINK